MPEKKKTRNDQEWLELIQECRTSGLTDREWCQMHSQNCAPSWMNCAF